MLVALSCQTLQPHRLLPARLLCPWDFPGKNTGVGCHSLLQEIFLTKGLNWGQYSKQYGNGEKKKTDILINGQNREPRKKLCTDSQLIDNKASKNMHGEKAVSERSGVGKNWKGA